MGSGLQRQMAQGAVWMVLFKLVERSLGLVSTLILARLLVPADFGIVAMAMSFVFMAELLTAFGFDVALIQNQSATEAHYNTAWTGNLMLGALITALMLAGAVPIANFYQRPELTWVVTALAFGPLLSGAENIGVVAFRKELDFRREFRFQISRKLIAFCVVVPLAFVLRNYWALVIGTLVSKLSSTVISYLMHPFRPRLTLSQFRPMLHFSRWLLMNNVVSFLKERSSDFFIGRLHGPRALGVYNIGYEFAHLPSTELSAPINRALLPGFAKMTRPEEIRAAYANAVGLLALLTLPAAAGIFAVAPFLVPVILGPKWIEAVPLMQVLAFNGALLLFHSSMCTVLVGRGHPASVTLANAVYVALLVLALWLAAGLGVRGAAYAVLGTSLLSTPVYLYQMRRCLGVGPTVFMVAIARPLIAAALMAATLHVLLPAAEPGQSVGEALFWLAIGVGAGFLSYVFLALALWTLARRPAGPEQLLWSKLRDRWAARQLSAAASER
jgi:lipopolysaccharide exporter